MANTNLHLARKSKNDEFYTQYKDIEKELSNYDISNRVVYLPCDDYRKSDFWKFFEEHFERLGLKGLYATCYGNDPVGASIVDGVKREWHLTADGDFRSDECKQYFDLCDTVITNPPFSLFRDFFSLLIESVKGFLIVGNMNAVTYENVTDHIRKNEVWLGVSPRCMDFITDEGYIININSCWFTNFHHKKQNKVIKLSKNYEHEHYEKFDNYNVVNVNKVKDIPKDYYGPIAVPITFLCQYNPNQFEILHCDDYVTNPLIRRKKHGLIKDAEATINGKATYVRVIIKIIR